jgi:hypothetical protein
MGRPFVALGLTPLTFAAAVAGAQVRARAATMVPLRGVVFDSVRGHPVAGALVTIDPGRSTRTDERGRFRFDSVRRGPQTISVQHASFDTLGLYGISRTSDVDGDGEVQVGVPSLATLWRNACGTSEPPADSSIVYGVVREAKTGRPIPGARLELAWSELALKPVNDSGGNEVVDRHFRSETRTVANGSYALCNAPTETLVRLRAFVDSATTGAIEIDVGGVRVHRQDLTLASTANRSGLVVGYLSDGSGAPFIDARVMLDDSTEVRSEFDGRFVFPGAPTGTHQIVARYIGAAPTRATIDIVPRDTTRVAMTMAKVTRLATTNVTSPARASMLREGWEARQLMYQHFMIDSSTIKRYSSLQNVFQTLPSTRVRSTGVAGFTILVPDRRNGEPCTPELRVDGVMVNDYGQLLTIPPNRVVGIEVYPFASQIPAELQRGGIRYQCGLVAVWTKWAFRIP